MLVVSRLNNEYARYESPQIETKQELAKFLNEYREYFETDGRHHVWVGTFDNSGLLIYDQHNVIFAYGQFDKYIEILEREGFIEQKFSFPYPHCHNFYDDNDKFEKSILNHWEWELSPLGDNDEYDD